MAKRLALPLALRLALQALRLVLRVLQLGLRLVAWEQREHRMDAAQEPREPVLVDRWEEMSGEG